MKATKVSFTFRVFVLRILKLKVFCFSYFHDFIVLAVDQARSYHTTNYHAKQFLTCDDFAQKQTIGWKTRDENDVRRYP